jgi:hypothetical protein
VTTTTGYGWAGTNAATSSYSVPPWGYNSAGTISYPSYSAVSYQPTYAPGGYITDDDLAQERMTDVAERIKRRLERGNG